MKNNWAVMLGVIALLCALPVYAAESAPSAQSEQGKTMDEHAGHSAHMHAGSGGVPVANGKNSPVAWTAFPTLKIRMSGQRREDRVVTLIPQAIVAGSIDAYSNNTGDANPHRQLPLEMAGARLDKPQSGGFHWLSAREEQADRVRVASTVHFFGERGGLNPTEMFMRQKHELEIIPQPFPREHSRYRAYEDWKFLVRFNGSPLAGRKVFLETSNGSKAELMSDALGMVTASIPNDFKAETRQKTESGHDHGRRSADFVLATEYADGGKNYLTAFNSSYGTDAFDQRSLAMGLGFMLLGMIGAAPLLRKRNNAKRTDDTKPAGSEAANDKDA